MNVPPIRAEVLVDLERLVASGGCDTLLRALAAVARSAVERAEAEAHPTQDVPPARQAEFDEHGRDFARLLARAWLRQHPDR